MKKRVLWLALILATALMPLFSTAAIVANGHAHDDLITDGESLHVWKETFSFLHTHTHPHESGKTPTHSHHHCCMMVPPLLGAGSPLYRGLMEIGLLVGLGVFFFKKSSIFLIFRPPRLIRLS